MKKLWKQVQTEAKPQEQPKKQKPHTQYEHQQDNVEGLAKMMSDLRIQQLELQKAIERQNSGSELRGGAKPFYPPNEYENRQYPRALRGQNIRGCYWDGGAHSRDSCKDLGRAIEKGEVLQGD